MDEPAGLPTFWTCNRLYFIIPYSFCLFLFLFIIFWNEGREEGLSSYYVMIVSIFTDFLCIKDHPIKSFVVFFIHKVVLCCLEVMGRIVRCSYRSD